MIKKERFANEMSGHPIFDGRNFPLNELLLLNYFLTKFNELKNYLQEDFMIIFIGTFIGKSL